MKADVDQAHFVKGEQENESRPWIGRIEFGKARIKIEFEREPRSEPETSDTSLKLQLAREDLQTAEEIHARIAARIAQLTTESRAPARVTLIEQATLPEFAEVSAADKMLPIVATTAFVSPAMLVIASRLLHRRRRAGDSMAGQPL